MRSSLRTLGRALRPGRTAFLTTVGFGLICAAVWLLAGLAFGLLAVGGSLLIIEALGEQGGRR